MLARTTALVSWKQASTTVRRPVSEEMVWVLPAETPHAAHWHEPTPLMRILLAPEQLEAEVLRELTIPRVVRLVDLTRMDWTIARMVEKLWRVGGNGTVQPPPLSRTHAEELGTMILRAIYGPQSFCRLGGLIDERYHAVTDFIEANLTLKFSRELLAKEDGQSLHHFARMFKERSGLTPREYVTRRRCFRAREQIAAGKKLADVAAEVGFFDQPEMCRKFNEVFGCPPSTFMPEDET